MDYDLSETRQSSTGLFETVSGDDSAKRQESKTKSLTHTRMVHPKNSTHGIEPPHTIAKKSLISY